MLTRYKILISHAQHLTRCCRKRATHGSPRKRGNLIQHSSWKQLSGRVRLYETICSSPISTIADSTSFVVLMFFSFCQNELPHPWEGGDESAHLLLSQGSNSRFPALTHSYSPSCTSPWPSSVSVQVPMQTPYSTPIPTLHQQYVALQSSKLEET